MYFEVIGVKYLKALLKFVTTQAFFLQAIQLLVGLWM